MIEGRYRLLERDMHSDISRDVNGDDPERHLHVKLDVSCPLAAKVELDAPDSRIHPNVRGICVGEAIPSKAGCTERDLEHAHLCRVERVEPQLGVTRA